MRFLCRLMLSLLLVSPSLRAAEESSHPVANIYILRSAEQLQGPHVVTYRVFEWTQERGRWIMPDFGYFDTGYGREQIWFAGAGAKLVRTRHVDWEQELYVSQEAGPDSQNRRALWIWPVVALRFPARLSAQVAAYPTIPLDRTQRWGYDVDRAKLERTDTRAESAIRAPGRASRSRQRLSARATAHSRCGCRRSRAVPRPRSVISSCAASEQQDIVPHQ
jgi:hypothetical protein